jgi:hypothetical protein
MKISVFHSTKDGYENTEYAVDPVGVDTVRPSA